MPPTKTAGRRDDRKARANQAINPSSQPPSQVFAGHYVDYNPYDPISYAQNNTGRGGGGR